MGKKSKINWKMIVDAIFYGSLAVCSLAIWMLVDMKTKTGEWAPEGLWGMRIGFIFFLNILFGAIKLGPSLNQGAVSAALILIFSIRHDLGMKGYTGGRTAVLLFFILLVPIFSTGAFLGKQIGRTIRRPFVRRSKTDNS